MKIEKSMIATIAVASLAATLAFGCKKKEPEYVEPAPVPTPAPTPVVAPPPDTGCDALSMTTFSGIFASRSAIEAPKMTTEGGVVCGNVPEGGRVSGPSFFLQQGKCYTVVANGLPNVTEIDVALMIDGAAVGLPPAIVAMAATPLAVDSETGAMGTIGPKANCYKWALPIPAPVKVVVTARNGSGPIGAQVYSR